MGFHNEKIKVELSEGKPEPASFTWKGTEYKVKEIKKRWQERPLRGQVFGRGKGGSDKAWWNVQDKVWYRVVAEDGVTYELYRDERKKDWILARSVGKMEESPEGANSEGSQEA